MNMLTITAIWAAVYALFTLHQSPADTSTRVRSSIEAQYASRAAAVQNHDIRGVLDLLAPGYTLRYLDGAHATRAEWEAGLRTHMKEIQDDGKRAAKAGGEWKNPAKVVTVIQKFTMAGNRVVVTAVTTTTNTARYPKGLSYRATLEETAEDTWVKTALGWRLQRTEQLRNRTTVDESRTR